MTDVVTQTELDAAVERGDPNVDVRSSDGVWLYLSGSATVSAYDSATVSASDSATVSASDSATVIAYDSATVSASDSATVIASGSATVSASDSATVRASGSATVSAYDSATVRASGSATVRASDSATVSAYDSATVRASGSATVIASGLATVIASGSATVRASHSATVRASGSATVSAGKFVAVHLFSQRVTLSGGVLIDMSHIDAAKTSDWIELTGAEVTDGKIRVYKAVDDDYRSRHGTLYTVGAKVSCDDFRATIECGAGLHFSPTPDSAKHYDEEATRFLACDVLESEVQCIDSSKLKAPRCWVVAEVDQWTLAPVTT